MFPGSDIIGNELVERAWLALPSSTSRDQDGSVTAVFRTHAWEIASSRHRVMLDALFYSKEPHVFPPLFDDIHITFRIERNRSVSQLEAARSLYSSNAFPTLLLRLVLMTHAEMPHNCCGFILTIVQYLHSPSCWTSRMDNL